MPTSTIDVVTPHGVCPTQIFTPDGAGSWPAVIVCADAFGVRPSLIELAARIARGGYLVALPELFFRVGSAAKLLPSGARTDGKSLFGLFADPGLRAKFMKEYYAPTVAYDHLRDTIGPLLDALKTRADVRTRVGTTGYCMGGNVALRIATLFGDRIAATASFHGGSLATKEPDSPHLRLGSVRSRVYIAGASDDASFTDESKATLTKALVDARVDHKVETYPARHGFAIADNPAYDQVVCERHFAALDAFFAASLRR